MSFLAQFMVRGCDHKLALIRRLLTERGLCFRAWYESPSKSKRCVRFIPAMVGQIQTFEAIDLCRRSLAELKVKFAERLVLVVPQGLEVRGRLNQSVSVMAYYTCSHINPNHPGFQVFDTNDCFLAEQAIQDLLKTD